LVRHRRYFLSSLLVGILGGGPVWLQAQTAAPENWLRLEGYNREQRQALREEQESFTRSVEPLDLQQRRELDQRYLRESLEQTGLQNQQGARESTIRARSSKRPAPETQVDRTLRDQQYQTEQRRFRLQQRIERRSSTFGGVRPAPPRPTVDVGP
jgi:hypothetical protein